MKRLLAWSLALVTALTLPGCGSRDPLEANREQSDSIVVGSADFAESELLMDLYAEALRSTGTDVRTEGRIGAREIFVKAVRSGELAVVPDYAGNLLKFFDPGSRATSSRAVRDELRAKLPPGLDLLEQSRAENSDVLAVTRRTADSGLRSMADLGPRCRDLVLGAPAEWKSRWTAKIEQLYGCRFADVRSIEAGSVTTDALLGGQIQVANMFTTSSDLRAHDLVQLDDPKDMYPAQNVVPLVGAGRLNPRQVEALNRVSRALTTERLAQLNRRLEVDKDNPRDIAKEFVRQVDP